MRITRKFWERRRVGKSILVVAASVLLAAMGGDLMAQEAPARLEMTSPDVEQGKPIPKKFTCESEDVSPALNWSGAPEGTKSFALIMQDPDAPVGTFVHWVLYNIPADASGLPEGVPQDEVLTDGSVQGLNGFDKIGYNGPCPPPGNPHRYFFLLHALDTTLDLAPGASRDQVKKAMKGHVLGSATLIGTYQR